MGSRNLSELILLSKDGEWGKSEPFEDSVQMRVVRGTDFESVRRGDWSCVPTRYVPRKRAELKALQDGDLLIETAGGSSSRPTGRTIFLRPGSISDQNISVTCASFARFIRLDPELVEPEFVFWWLQHQYATRRLLAFHTQHTGVARFQWTSCARSLTIPLIERAAQQKIAAILSAYDVLIENNFRRIKSLQEMAQRIYREWFVDFRYPGHPGMPPVNSAQRRVTPGWEVGPLASICETIERGVTPSYEADTGRWIINQRCNRGPSLDASQMKELAAGLQVPASKLARRNDVLVNSLGEGTIGRVHLFRGPDATWAVDQHMSIVRAPDGPTAEYIYQRLSSADGQAELASLKTGATNMTMLNISKLRDLQVVIPPVSLLERLDQATAPMRELQAVLEANIAALRSSLGLLLPPLISGEIDVADLDIVVPDLAA